MKRLTQETKMTIQVIIATVLVIAGLALLFIGLYSPPPGEIHDSVLIAYGEVSTFSGSLLGIDYHYRYKNNVIEQQRKIDEKQE